MKTIYMEQTITLMTIKGMEGVEALISSGVVKKTEQGINYLVIDGDSIE